VKRHCRWRSRAGFSSSEPALGSIGLRSIEQGDLPFLRSLYAATRADEVSATGWPADECERFLAQQFEFQHHYYQSHYGDADFLLLLRDERPIGRLYWHERRSIATLIDVSLVPPERGRGFGSALLALLTAQADRQRQSIGLHVEPTNPALRLYRRFGFELVAHNGIYAKMRRPARESMRVPAVRTAS